MVAFIDLAPVPTANLFVMVPVALADGGWAWGELPRFAGVLAREYVYSAAECAALVKSYGRMVAAMIKPYEADRFCLTARGRVTGMILYRAEWVWNQYARGYVPDGEALDGWKVAARAHWEATGELVGSLRFQAHTEPLTVPSTLQPVPIKGFAGDRDPADVLPVAPAA